MSNKLKAKVRDLIRLYTAHANIGDGNADAVKSGDNAVIVKKPFKITGKVRWLIAKNRRKLRRVVELQETIRDETIKEITGGGTELDRKNKEHLKKFTLRMDEVERQEEEIIGLVKIPLADLNLDKNDIPTEALETLEEFGLITEPAGESGEPGGEPAGDGD